MNQKLIPRKKRKASVEERGNRQGDEKEKRKRMIETVEEWRRLTESKAETKNKGRQGGMK